VRVHRRQTPFEKVNTKFFVLAMFAVLCRAGLRLLIVGTQEVRFQTSADVEGRLRFEGVAPGNCFVTVLSPGFMKALEAIHVEEDKFLDVVHVRLHPAPC
jgi:hypothetical protein